MSAQAEGSGGSPAGVDARADVPVGALLTAGLRLATATRKSASALLALMHAEAHLLRTSTTLVLLGGIALIAFAVSLWACLVALAGWTLTLALHSLGGALAVLVGVHLLLVVATALFIRRVLRQATFPHSREELSALRRSLGHELAQFRQATTPATTEPAE